MPESPRLQAVRANYAAYEHEDREAIERLLSHDLVFSAPPDVGIDRATYFERCWANAGHIQAYSFVRMAEVGDEVLVTYEATRTDGSRFRNSEIFGFAGDRIDRIEVYFGWNLED
ncbi:MAG: nuclear transport factor 2 family protein [Patulibacter sp.]